MLSSLGNGLLRSADANTLDGRRRRCTAAAVLATALTLSACGGGAEIRSNGDFSIGIFVSGLFIRDSFVAPGGSVNVVIRAGESLKLDAREPVQWTLLVGGSAVTGNGSVYYAGADIRATTLSSSTVVLDTHAVAPLQTSIPITLIATSTYDSAQVATVDVLITN